MIVEMRKGAPQDEVNGVIERARSLNLDIQLNQGTDKTVVAILGSNTGQLSTDLFAVLPGVEQVVRIMKPYKLASREFQPHDTVFSVNGIEIGGKGIVVMAGPCAVENEQQLMEAARIVKRSGARILRGGAFKPRTSPFSFQGMEKAGLELLARAREQLGLVVVTEVVDPHDVSLVSKYADILQVGARNMQNFPLLTKIGKSKRPVILKRGFSCTVTEWLAAGLFSLVPAVAKAAIAAGADGLLIEVHPNPKEALVDGLQSLTPSDFARLMKEIKSLAVSVGRSFQ